MEMKKILFILAMIATIGCCAQNNDYVFAIEGYDTVYAEEFISSFNKNNQTNTPEALDEYLNLYINYKLKLLDAKSLNLQNDSNIISEIQKYREDITKPYINDPKVMDSLAQDAYDKQSTLIRVKHILISVPKNVAPDDTLQYYKKAMNIYYRLKKGEDFDKLADEYSDDPSTQSSAKYPNSGDLGYFTSMVMIYPFEKACYDMLRNNDTLTWCKTDFGYHIIKYVNSINTKYFSYALRHIYINSLEHSESEAESLINQAYEDIKTLGVDSTAKKYSEDNYSKIRGGMITNQKANSLPAEYVEKMETMAKGEISAPFKTRFGWHIIQFLDAAPIMEYSQQKSMIMDRISKDARAYISLERFFEQAKKDYNYMMDSAVLKSTYTCVNDSVFSATWTPTVNANASSPLFTLTSLNDTAQYTLQMFLDYIYEHQTKQVPINLNMYVNKMYDTYSKYAIVKFAEQHLEDKYPEIKTNLEQYKDGELIFAVTDLRVWNKSLTDTVGLQDFYEKNKADYLYTPRADAVIWNVDTSLNLKKIQKLIVKYKKKNWTDDEIKNKLNDKFTSASDTTKNGKKRNRINFVWNRFERGNNNIIDKSIFEGNSSLSDIKTPAIFVDKSSITNRNIIVYLNEIMPISQKPLAACKGLCTSDYQEYLEKQWIEELHKKYSININRIVFNKLREQTK